MRTLRPLLAVIGVILLLPAAALAAAPVAVTGAASGVGPDTATVNGVVNPNNETTTYHFEYGTTTAYGTSTPEATVNGNKGKDVSAVLAGLKPSTAYHFRLVATNPSGTVQGNDATFTTAAPGATTGTPAISITAKPVTITFGRSTLITGKVTGDKAAGTQVELQQTVSPFTTPFAKTATTTADAAGVYSFIVRPTVNTRYQASAKTKPPVTSTPVEVGVRRRVTFRVARTLVAAGTRVRFSGTVSPSATGRRVAIQRRTASGFKTVTRALLRTAADGRCVYRKKVRINKKATYRVRIAGDAANRRGTSRRRTIRVR